MNLLLSKLFPDVLNANQEAEAKIENEIEARVTVVIALMSDLASEGRAPPIMLLISNCFIKEWMPR
jgi:hypothetical protein